MTAFHIIFPRFVLKTFQRSEFKLDAHTFTEQRRTIHVLRKLVKLKRILGLELCY